MVEEGQRIELIRVTPDRHLPYRYAGAAEDFNPIHVDEEFARSVGLPGNILHGLYGMGLLARGLVEQLGDGDPRRLRRLRLQFRAMGFPEQEIEADATVREVGEETIVVDAEASQGESPLIREAEAELTRQ
jgi:acyl dehydratase